MQTRRSVTPSELVYPSAVLSAIHDAIIARRHFQTPCATCWDQKISNNQNLSPPPTELRHLRVRTHQQADKAANHHPDRPENCSDCCTREPTRNRVLGLLRLYLPRGSRCSPLSVPPPSGTSAAVLLTAVAPGTGSEEVVHVVSTPHRNGHRVIDLPASPVTPAAVALPREPTMAQVAASTGLVENTIQAVQTAVHVRFISWIRSRHGMRFNDGLSQPVIPSPTLMSPRCECGKCGQTMSRR
jgi:hypothetical protein